MDLSVRDERVQCEEMLCEEMEWKLNLFLRRMDGLILALCNKEKNT